MNLTAGQGRYRGAAAALGGNSASTEVGLFDIALEAREEAHDAHCRYDGGNSYKQDQH